MKLLRIAWRLLRVLPPIAAGLMRGRSAAHLRGMASHPPEPAAQQEVQRKFRQFLECLNVRVAVHGTWAGAPCLVVSNHISWLDILVLGSAVPVVFLSKEEVRRWPLIGSLADAGGTLYIKRGSEGAARESIEAIGKALRRRQSVAIFPEGTTSVGREVLRYHPRLFAAAIENRIAVQPTALCYPHPDGAHPLVPFVDDDALVPSLWKVLGCRRVDAEVHLGAAIDPAGLDRGQLAAQARAFTEGVVEGDRRGPPRNAAA